MPHYSLPTVYNNNGVGLIVLSLLSGAQAQLFLNIAFRIATTTITAVRYFHMHSGCPGHYRKRTPCRSHEYISCAGSGTSNNSRSYRPSLPRILIIPVYISLS